MCDEISIKKVEMATRVDRSEFINGAIFDKVSIVEGSYFVDTFSCTFGIRERGFTTVCWSDKP